MKRKIYAILIASIILGAGAVVATGAVSDVKYPSFASVTKMRKNTDTLSTRESGEYITSLTKVSTDAVELKEPYKQYHKEELLTTEKKSFCKKIIGQWGYMNNPQSQGTIVGIYNGKTIKGSYTTTTNNQEIDFKVDLKRSTFSGKIYIRQYRVSLSAETNIPAVAVVPIYGVYSISNGHITAFGSKGIWEPSLSNTPDQVFDCWFFGELS